MAGKTFSVLCSILLLLSLLAVAGCSKKFTPDMARANVSPSLDTLALTREQMKNRYARTFDVNLRQFNEDVDTLLLLDRSSYLSRTPMP